MKNQKSVNLLEAQNGYRVSWPLFNLIEDRNFTNIFYTNGFPGTKISTSRLVIAKGRARYDKQSDKLIPPSNLQDSFKYTSEPYTLIDVTEDEEKAIDLCKREAHELAKEKSKGKHQILEDRLKNKD